MISVSTTEIDNYLAEVKKTLSGAKGDKQLFKAIVDAAFIDKRLMTVFGLGFLTFLLYNKETGNIDRIIKTDNELARLGGEISIKPFSAIKIPIGYHGNIVAEAIRSGRYQQTSDWTYILSPDLNAEESRLNQANSGISYCFVYPIKGRDGGALIFHYYINLPQITPEHRNFMYRYTKLVGMALDGKLT